jgi:hypothetical protein
MRRLLFITAIALAPLAACSKAEKAETAEKADPSKHEANLPEISVADAAAGMEVKQVTFVDCNSDKTRKREGIIPSAILLDDEETFTASALPGDKAAKLVFYCSGPG